MKQKKTIDYSWPTFFTQLLSKNSHCEATNCCWALMHQSQAMSIHYLAMTPAFVIYNEFILPTLCREVDEQRGKQWCEWRLQCCCGAIDLRQTQLASESDNITDEQQACAHTLVCHE